MTSRTGRFLRSDRILRSPDFQRISRRGRRSSGLAFVMLFATPPADRVGASPRLGITASRKVGNAVTRNRIKRGVREWFRHNRDEIPGALDVVIIARRSAAELTGSEIALRLEELLHRSKSGRTQRSEKE
jgi:ribonuclease P protein component